jgi:hypothetical protein
LGNSRRKKAAGKTVRLDGRNEFEGGCALKKAACFNAGAVWPALLLW